jgi:hypothetical protein
MFSVLQVTRETFSFFYNHFGSLVKNLWFIVLANLFLNYALDVSYGDVLFRPENLWIDHSVRCLGLLILSPFYARPVFNMVVHGVFERPNVLGITWSMSDTRYICWGFIFLLPCFLVIGLSQLVLSASLAFEGLSPQDSLYDSLALGTVVLLLLLFIVFFVALFFGNRLFLTLLSFYDKKSLSFKASWSLTRKRAIKIFLASTGVFTCLWILSHHVDYLFLGEAIETLAICLQIIASCIVYKDILKSGARLNKKN